MLTKIKQTPTLHTIILTQTERDHLFHIFIASKRKTNLNGKRQFIRNDIHTRRQVNAYRIDSSKQRRGYNLFCTVIFHIYK